MPHSTALDGFAKTRASRLKRGLPVRFAGIHKPQGPIADLQKRGVLVIGASGLMGKRILQNAWQNGFNTAAMDMNQELSRAAIDDVALKHAVSNNRGLIKDAKYQEIKDLSPVALDSQMLARGEYRKGDLPESGLVVEAIFENLAVKQATFQNLEKLLPEDTIFATNTSSLSVNKIAEGMKHPERVIGLHYFLPAHKNRLVEIIPGKHTTPEVIEKTMAFARACGKVPVVVNGDSPGFAANRMFIAFSKAGLDLYEDGYDPKLIDQVARETFWPDGVGVPKFEQDMMPPLDLCKKYGALGVEISQNLGALGEFYKPARTLLDEHQRVSGFKAKNGPLEQAKAALQSIQRSHLKEVVPEYTAFETNHSLRDLENPSNRAPLENSLNQVSNARQQVGALEKEAQYFPNGFPPKPASPEVAKKNIAEQRADIENRLLGVYHAVSRQIVSEGLCSPEDINTLAKVGFQWNIRPRSPEAIQAALEAVRVRYGDDLPIPDIDPKQVGLPGIKTRFNPQTGSYTIALDNVRDLMGTNNFNVLDSKTLHSIQTALREANENPDVKSIVFSAHGGKIFCAGADINEVMANVPDAEKQAYLNLGRQVMSEIASSPKPTVAVLQGDAYGGGVELALACDKIVAADDATLNLPEVNMGIFPAWGGTERLPEKIGKPLAKAVILGGKSKLAFIQGFPKPVQNLINGRLNWEMNTKGVPLDAKTAHEVGLVQELVKGHASLEHVVQNLLQDPAFLEKPAPQRGLERFPTVESYPDEIRHKFQLDNVESRTRKHAGAFSKQSWEVANRLIDAAGTPESGRFDEAEMRQMLANAREKYDKMTSLVDAGKAYMAGKTGKNAVMMAQILLMNKQMLTGGR